MGTTPIGKAMPAGRARSTARGSPRVLAGLAAVAVVLAGCGEPSPTVISPPNPTSAPASVLPACVVNGGTPTPASPPASRTGDYTIAQPGLLSVGSVPSDPPFESLQNGRAVGFDVDLIAEVARRLGLAPEIVGESPGALLGDVARGKTDVAISALSVVPAAAAVVDFTTPYFTDDLALTVGVEQARGFPGIAALAGKVVGVPAGSYAEACARLVAAEPGTAFTVVGYTTISQAFTDLAAGRIGGVLADLPTAQRLAQAIIGLQMVAIYRTNDRYAIAVAKTNPNLRVDIDRILGDMEADGTYRLIYEKWFQVPPPSG
jgi:ABC-type amino acid transport substrate-binding protein